MAQGAEYSLHMEDVMRSTACSAHLYRTETIPRTYGQVACSGCQTTSDSAVIILIFRLQTPSSASALILPSAPAILARRAFRCAAVPPENLTWEAELHGTDQRMHNSLTSRSSVCILEHRAQSGRSVSSSMKGSGRIHKPMAPGLFLFRAKDVRSKNSTHKCAAR